MSTIIISFIVFGLYVACVLFVAKMAFAIAVLVLQVTIKCLPYAVGLWIVLMVLKGCAG